MEQIISHGNKRETYNEFIDKFKPERTTDDCFTPKPVYDAVLQFVEERRLSRLNKVRNAPPQTLIVFHYKYTF